MNPIFTIIRKELIATLRDRRTLMSAIFIPVLATPLLLLGITKLQKVFNDKESNKTLKIALFNAPPTVAALFQDPKINIIQHISLPVAKDSVANENYDAILDFDKDFDQHIDSLKTGKLSFYYKSTNVMVEKRVMQKLDQYKAGLMSARFKRLNLSQDLLTPIRIDSVDIASTKEQIGVLIGGILPYFFILFCFLGCMYPAFDLITGEKEKGTIETLLTAPVGRFQILLAKVITIALVGVCAAFMTISGMFLALRFLNEIPKEIFTTVNDILTLKFVVLLFAMLIPLSLFLAGMLSAIVIRANSFKEAQSYVTPLTFVVIVPAMIALMPGIKLSWETSWIPVLNIALATKEIIAGTINYAQYGAIVVSLILFAIAAITISVRQFSKENNILN